MAKSRSRKFQLTINNPQDCGYTQERIKEIMQEFTNMIYYCCCDEIGENGTYHTHVYFICKNAVEFNTVHKRFYGAHIELVYGTNQENRDYIRKEGKWEEDRKKETNLPETFYEYGELPPDVKGQRTDIAEIHQMIKDGVKIQAIIEEYPSAIYHLQQIENARQTIIADEFADTFRKLEVTYIYGSTGTGKTSGVMNKYGYRNVYRVTDYEHPFDGYNNQDVIIFEEFRSSLKIEDMLKYLDGYPVELPARFHNKAACFTKVYIISNIRLDEQYINVQLKSPETYKAFLRRIHHIEKKGNLQDSEFSDDLGEDYEIGEDLDF